MILLFLRGVSIACLLSLKISKGDRKWMLTIFSPHSLYSENDSWNGGKDSINFIDQMVHFNFFLKVIKVIYAHGKKKKNSTESFLLL